MNNKYSCVSASNCRSSEGRAVVKIIFMLACCGGVWAVPFAACHVNKLASASELNSIISYGKRSRRRRPYFHEEDFYSSQVLIQCS